MSSGACPKCNSNLEFTDQNLGTLFTCPKCSAVFFVGWDGVPEANINDSQSSHQSGGAELETFAASSNTYETTESQSVSSSSDPILPDFASVEDIAAHEIIDDFNPSSDQSALQEIADFGNASQEAGPLAYSVFVKGIDTAENIRQLREALTDQRFAWEIENVMGQIVGGSLSLEKVSSAKAIVLISRLKGLGLEIEWRQDVLPS